MINTYLNLSYIDRSDSLLTVSDANRPMVDRQTTDFVFDFICFLGLAGGKKILTDKFFFRSTDCLWDLANGLESTNCLSTIG